MNGIRFYCHRLFEANLYAHGTDPQLLSILFHFVIFFDRVTNEIHR